MIKRLCTICAFVSLAISANSFAQSSIYLIGNSVTDGIHYGEFESTIEAATGKPFLQARHVILGAPLSFIWENADGGFQDAPYGHYPNALTNYTWDFISLQPWDAYLKDDIVNVQRYIDLAKPKNPNTQFVLLAHHMRTDNIKAGQTYQTFWDQPYNNGQPWGVWEARQFYEMLADSVTKKNPTMKRILLIPTGEVFYDLDKIMRAGGMPGKTDIISAAYSDGIHTTNFGSYIVACTYYSVLFKKNPTDFSPAKWNVSAADAAIVQKAIWDEVSTNKRCGVASTPVVQRTLKGNAIVNTGSSTGAAYSIMGKKLQTRSALRGVFLVPTGDGAGRKGLSLGR